MARKQDILLKDTSVYYKVPGGNQPQISIIFFGRTPLCRLRSAFLNA